MQALNDNPKDEIWFLAQNLKHFSPFISQDVGKRLANAGIELEGVQVTLLISGLKSFEVIHTELYVTKGMTVSEQRIIDLADELAMLIKESPLTHDGWRYTWGEASSDEETPDCQDCLEIAEFLKQLRIVRASAVEGVDALRAGLASNLLPGSNRANRLRYFYWLLLLAYWKNDLKREVKMSNSEARGPCGDLISFIQALSAGGVTAGIVTEAELSGDAIRQFIRRNMMRIESVMYHFQI